MEIEMPNPGLYIHIPFCRSKCPYCDFYSISSSSLVSRWLKALKKEIVLYAGQFESFDTLYLGGGTPSMLSLGDLEQILSSLSDHFLFSEDTEKTIEANPCDMIGEMIEALKGLGFNRINLGIQSFNDRDLHFLGRRHSAKEAEDALERLRASGFNNIGMDLIYGLRDQSIKGWIETLESALVFRPEHLSCYQLSFEKGTLFWRLKEKEIIPSLDEEGEIDLFLATSEFLEDRGYIHYEVSNFAKEMVYRSRHNSKYWNRVPYLGLGPSAHSFDGTARWWNYRSIRKYCEALERGEPPIDGREELTEEQQHIEIVSLGLRTREGVKLIEIEHDNQLREKISELRDAGYIRFDNNRIIPTRKGFLVADRLPICLFM